MSDLFLTEPNIEYQNSFENYALAYRNINDEHYYNKYKKVLEDFLDYLNDLYNYSKGNDLPQGDVVTSTFWLIDDKCVVGVVRVRHEELDCAGHIGYDISPDCRNKGYGNEILKLALEEAAKIGLEEVIITCHIDNIASRKIIEKNNGKLVSTIYDKEDDRYLYKYIVYINSN